MSTGELLGIQPLELTFPCLFELKKQMSCSLQLSNKTDQRVDVKKVLRREGKKNGGGVFLQLVIVIDILGTILGYIMRKT